MRQMSNQFQERIKVQQMGQKLALLQERQDRRAHSVLTTTVE